MTTNTKTKLDAELINKRQATLDAAAAQLKLEMVGIDSVIDRVISDIRSWYVMPELITRPVVVCLWGLTGTGKTQLTRRLSQLIGFYDKFVEVQMDGFNTSESSYRAKTSITGILGASSIHEGAPGILVMDEFQKFRTVAKSGDDAAPPTSFNDVWLLLSDGRLPPKVEALANVERKIAEAQYAEDHKDDEDEDEQKKNKNFKFKIDVWDAADIRDTFKLRVPLVEIMQYDPQQVQDLYAAFQDDYKQWETDYSKLLIFVSGNLDELYQEIATNVEDCDTDADSFHRATLKMTVIDVKRALRVLFKPEQIARLGSNHVIYPAFSRATYEELIRRTCNTYLENVADVSGVTYHPSKNLLDRVYDNAVFPTQGTRPMFSAVHSIMSSAVVNTTIWAIENKLDNSKPVDLDIDVQTSSIVAKASNGMERITPVQLAITKMRNRTDPKFKALLAVHETGHGLVHGLLFGETPESITINPASFAGGYNTFSALKVQTARDIENQITVLMAGRAAEIVVFGDAHSTTGASQDIAMATALAAKYFRSYGFGKSIAKVDHTADTGQDIVTGVEQTDPLIIELVNKQKNLAITMIRENDKLMKALTSALLAKGSLTTDEFQAVAAQHGLALTKVELGGDETITSGYDVILENWLN